MDSNEFHSRDPVHSNEFYIAFLAAQITTNHSRLDEFGVRICATNRHLFDVESVQQIADTIRYSHRIVQGEVGPRRARSKSVKPHKSVSFFSASA